MSTVSSVHAREQISHSGHNLASIQVFNQFLRKHQSLSADVQQRINREVHAQHPQRSAPQSTVFAAAAAATQTRGDSNNSNTELEARLPVQATPTHAQMQPQRTVPNQWERPQETEAAAETGLSAVHMLADAAASASSAPPHVSQSSPAASAQTQLHTGDVLHTPATAAAVSASGAASAAASASAPFAQQPSSDASASVSGGSASALQPRSLNRQFDLVKTRALKGGKIDTASSRLFTLYLSQDDFAQFNRCRTKQESVQNLQLLFGARRHSVHLQPHVKSRAGHVAATIDLHGSAVANAVQPRISYQACSMHSCTDQDLSTIPLDAALADQWHRALCPCVVLLPV